jgi:hypothetical protein
MAQKHYRDPRDKLEGDPIWRPWHTDDRRHKRIFSDDEQAAMVSFLRDNFITPGLIFADSDFREIAMNAFLAKYPDADLNMPMFQCSAGLIAMFKAQHRLTTRKIHFKRRSALTDEQRQRWVISIQELLRTVSWDRIINCDEISWPLHRIGILTWAEVGTESVQTKIEHNEKKHFTVVSR